MELIEWMLTIGGTIVAGTVIYIGQIIRNLPTDFVPRPQIDKRFSDLEMRMHDDNQQLQASMQDVERRTDRQLDKLDLKLDTLDSKLDRIFEKLGGKADAWRPGDQDRRGS